MNWIALERLALEHQRELRQDAEQQRQAELVVRVHQPASWPWTRLTHPAPTPPCVTC